MPTLDPLNPQVEMGLTQSPSPLLDIMISALSMDPNSRPIVAGLVNARQNLALGRQRRMSGLAGQGFAMEPGTPDPTTITEPRGPIGALAQKVGLVGEPTPRPLTPEENVAVQYGRLQRLKYKTLLEHLYNQNELERAKIEALNEQNKFRPEEQAMKRRKEFLDYSKEYGVQAGTDLLGTLMRGGELPGPPERYGVGAAQKRAKEATGAKEPSVYVKNRNAFKDATTTKIAELKDLIKQRGLGAPLTEAQQKRYNQLVTDINEQADKYGQPHIDEPLPVEETVGGGGNFLGSLGGLAEKHPLVRSVENLGRAAGGLLFGPPSAKAAPAKATPTPKAGATPGELDLGDGFKVRIKQR